MQISDLQQHRGVAYSLLMITVSVTYRAQIGLLSLRLPMQPGSLST